jgi:hypothetical protein
VPKVLSSRFHATATTRSEPPAKRQRRCGGGGGGADWAGGAGTGAGSGGGVGGSGDDSAAAAAPAPHLSIFRTFATQQAAFDFWDSQAPGTHLLRAFAVERDGGGRRTFIIAAPERFWSEYKALPHAARNHYEVWVGGWAGGRVVGGWVGGGEVLWGIRQYSPGRGRAGAGGRGLGAAAEEGARAACRTCPSAGIPPPGALGPDHPGALPLPPVL